VLDWAMRLSNAQMYDRFLAGDAAFNGRFLAGVTTTGIYCLPSCHARKARRSNVRFFSDAAGARAAGFRPCLKCRPDDFAKGLDPLLETTEALVGAVRSCPGEFPDSRAVVRRSGFGTTRAFELLRQHYQATPADLLLSARLESARRSLLGGSLPLADVAAEAGFESLSAFHENFRRESGMTPAAYRKLARSACCRIALPADYPLPSLRRFLGRDPHSVSDRLEGDRYAAGLRLDGSPARIELELAAGSVRLSVEGGSGAVRPPLVAAREAVVRLLGLGQDVRGFVRKARSLGLARLVKDREGLRVCQSPIVFDGLVWSIIGQQINFPFACLLRRRLFEKAGSRVAGGLRAPPSPGAIAALDASDLRSLQFSRQKADHLIGVARMAASGELDPEGLRNLSATRVERTLLAIRGLGPWSVNYVMMRSLGLPDCVPLGDTGVTSGLQRLFRLEARPDRDATLRLMKPFSPFRSLATAHLWNLPGPSSETP
jgi:AraC family transcriptional regulator, regulatory protein of adaptative response / DNA-3-methyladenine glycosylase II